MANIVKFYNVVLKIVGIACAVALWFIVGLIAMEVIQRDVFNIGSHFAIETCTYLTVFLAFIGGAYTQWVKKHIVVDTLSAKIPRTGQRWLETVILALCVITIGVFLYWSMIMFVEDIRLNTEAVGAMRISIAIPHFALVLGFALLLIILLVQFIASSLTMIRGNKLSSDRSI